MLSEGKILEFKEYVSNKLGEVQEKFENAEKYSHAELEEFHNIYLQLTGSMAALICVLERNDEDAFLEGEL